MDSSVSHGLLTTLLGSRSYFFFLSRKCEDMEFSHGTEDALNLEERAMFRGNGLSEPALRETLIQLDSPTHRIYVSHRHPM